MEAFLETERLVLRPFVAADVERLFALHNDPDVMRFLTGGDPVSREEIEDEVRERFARPGRWVAIERASEAVLGWFEFRPADARASDEFELGYRLRKDA